MGPPLSSFERAIAVIMVAVYVAFCAYLAGLFWPAVKHPASTDMREISGP